MNIMVDLVLDNGGIVRITAPAKAESDLHESLDNARMRGDTWAPGGVCDDCRAAFMGMYLSRVDMRRVIGML